MQIGIDATPLALSSGGLRRYTEELSKALASTFPGDDFHLLTNQNYALSPCGLANLHCARRAAGRYWWLLGVQAAMRKAGITVFHGTNFEVPYLPFKPSVMSVHDLSPWMDSRWHGSAGRVRRRTPMLLQLGLATMTITPSETVRSAAIDRFGLHPSRVVVIPDAAAVCFRPVVRAEPGQGNYFVYGGTLEPRKNVPVIIEAWRALRKRTEVELVLAGRLRNDAQPVAPEPGLQLAGEVSDGRLAELFSGAVAVLYPSAYEGFGLPVLEAMQCGAAVITSRDPAITEIAHGVAMQVEAGDSHALMQAMECLLNNSAERQRRQGLSLKRAAAYSWIRTAQLTRDVYREAVDRFGR